MTRAFILAAVCLSSAATWAVCSLPEDCRCGESPEWAATIHLTGEDAGAVVDTLSVRAGSDGGPDPLLLAHFTGDAGTRFLMTPPSYEGVHAWGLYPIGADGKVHCANDSAYEAVGWTHSLTTFSCYARLKADKAVLEKCNDVKGCAVAPESAAALGLALLLGAAVRRRRRARD